MNRDERPAPTYSAVIPIYNSAASLGGTIAACCAFFETRGLDYEIVAVDDGSADASWRVLTELAEARPSVIAVRLLRNYGQHTAVLCGLRVSRGTWVVTLDDDLQNPPEEIEHLLAKAREGFDVVFGRFRAKRHPLTRRLGSRVVERISRRIFGTPAGLKPTNFRLLHRSVVDRILTHRTSHPYINGLAVLYADRPGEAAVEHRERAGGRSQYGLRQVIELVGRILFNYSALPLRLVSLMGMAIAALSFVLASYFLARALGGSTTVRGWASIAVMLAFFNGVLLLVLGMLGEYVQRILEQISLTQPYQIAEVRGR